MTSPSITFLCFYRARPGLGWSSSSTAASAAGGSPLHVRRALSGHVRLARELLGPLQLQAEGRRDPPGVHSALLQEAQWAPKHHRCRRDQRIHLWHDLRGARPRARPHDVAHDAGAPRCRYTVRHR